jgi:hypothetical protein
MTEPPRATRRRWLLAASIVIFWVVMMGLLVRREVVTPRIDPWSAHPTRLSEPTESWMGLFLAGGGERVGYVHLQQIPETRSGLDGVTTRLALRMSVDLFGRKTALDLSGTAFRPYDESTAELELQVRSGEHDFRIEGRVADGVLEATVLSAGETIPLSVPVDGDLVFSSGFGTALKLPDLAIGDEVRVASFDPLSLRAVSTTVRCVAQQIRAIGGEQVSTRVLSLDSGGMRSRAWIDDDGEVVRAETPFVVLERVSAAEALAPPESPGAAGLAGLLELTAIRPSGRRPRRGATSMTVKLSGVDTELLPEDDVQRRLASQRFRIRTSPPPGDDAPLAEGAPELLVADAFVQANHPTIRRQAERIVADRPLSWGRARALHEWVYANLEKEPVISIPSALEVLARRRGDCNEHAVLYTALARSVGVPTRIAIGIVWSDELGGFYYHAWPEVLVGERWIWIDPTLGQETADATHIKLLNGGIETWTQLLPFLGRLEIEVLEVE